MKFIEHMIYLTLYFTSIILDMFITNYSLNHTQQQNGSEILLSKYLLIFTKILFIFEMAFYSGFYFIKSIAFRLQILLCRGFSLLFVICLGIINEWNAEIILGIVVDCITIVFLALTMNEDNDVVFHLYNKRASTDYLEFKLYIVEELINTSKKVTLIWEFFYAMQDFFTKEELEFYTFHIINLAFLTIDYFVSKSHIKRENSFIFSYIVIASVWIFGLSTIIVLLCFYKVYRLILIYLLEVSYTLIVIFFLIRTNIIRKIKKRRIINGTSEVV
ncbi:uncharacterized protein VNE69_06153 [Vairimorpha necatrix]|uniref:Membrane protein n=1 Tax=Vairimorpha necatrix TaxID=6039 RepID=A0AAX4JD00_9MICR